MGGLAQTEKAQRQGIKIDIKFKKVFYSILTIVVFLALWEIFARIAQSSYIPTPAGVMQAVAHLVINGDYEGYSMGEHALASCIRVFAGFGVAFVMGVTLGISMGLYPSIYRAIKVIIEPIRFIPPIAWIPIAIVLLSGFSRYMFIIWLGSFFPIFISVLSSIPKVDPILKDVVKSCGGSRLATIKKVIIPSIMPEILAGTRIGLGDSWMCIVAAEMIGGENVGLGRLILKYADLLMTNEIIVGMVVIGIIGYLCNEAVLLLERRLFKWREITH